MVISQSRLKISPRSLQAGAVLAFSNVSGDSCSPCFPGRDCPPGKACWAGVQHWPQAWPRQRYPVTGYPYSREDLVLRLSGFFPFTGSGDRARFEPGNTRRAPRFLGIEVIIYAGAGGRLGGGAAWESSDRADVMAGDSTCRESFCRLLQRTFA